MPRTPRQLVKSTKFLPYWIMGMGTVDDCEILSMATCYYSAERDNIAKLAYSMCQIFLIDDEVDQMIPSRV